MFENAEISDLLAANLSPDAFLKEASFWSARRRTELGARFGFKPDLEAYLWQEVHTLLLKAILDELVKARKGIRT